MVLLVRVSVAKSALWMPPPAAWDLLSLIWCALRWSTRQQAVRYGNIVDNFPSPPKAIRKVLVNWLSLILGAGGCPLDLLDGQLPMVAEACVYTPGARQ